MRGFVVAGSSEVVQDMRCGDVNDVFEPFVSQPSWTKGATNA